jgi:hypothetical protein
MDDMSSTRIPGYAYAQVESALGMFFGAPPSAQGSLRSRIRHFQRIGLVEIAPGKGRRISYSRVQAAEWLLALLLSEFGIDPVVIVKSIKAERTQLREWISEATDAEALGGNEVWLTARPALMSGGWVSKQSAGIMRFKKSRFPIGTTPPVGLSVAPSPEDPKPAGPDLDLDAQGFATGAPDLGTAALREVRVLDRADPLLLVINLTAPVRTLEAALDSAPSD